MKKACSLPATHIWQLHLIFEEHKSTGIFNYQAPAAKMEIKTAVYVGLNCFPRSNMKDSHIWIVHYFHVI